MASKDPKVNKAITDAINNSPPMDDNLTASQKADREKATTEYLDSLADGQTRTRLRSQNERYKG